MSFKQSLLQITLLLTLLPCHSMAAFGLGLHWGNDFSLHMNDITKQQLSFEALSIDTASISGNKPDYLNQINNQLLPIFINRTDWEKKAFNFGAKIFIDRIPIIDAIELSTNFGIWQYNGSITYPVSMSYRQNIDANNISNPDSIFDIGYDTLPVTLEKFDMKFFGLKNTPFMKLHFDLTIRKNIVLTHAKVFRLYTGCGPSLHFATPVLSKSLIEDALGNALEGLKPLNSLSTDLFDNDELTRKILKKITRSLIVPHWGFHITAGTMIKLPAIPLGFYFDTKLMIAFDNIDDNANIKGVGLLLNSGVTFSF